MSAPRWFTHFQQTNRLGNEFYHSHRAEMDAGAQVAWPERKYDDDLSGIQHAMNLRIDDEAVFFAEYQNEPQLLVEMESTMMSAGWKRNVFGDRLAFS